jgi:hypothetical protein
LPGSAARKAAIRSFTAFTRSGFVGPRFDPFDASTAGPAPYGIGVVADGRLQKYLGSLNGWPINAEPTGLSPRTIRLPLA